MWVKKLTTLTDLMRPWMLANIIVISLAVPLAWYTGIQIYPDFPYELRFRIHILAFLVCYPLYLVWILISLRWPLVGVTLILAGNLIRLTALLMLNFWLGEYFKHFLRPGLLLFLIAIGSFLLFEIVSLLSVKYHARK